MDGEVWVPLVLRGSNLPQNPHITIDDSATIVGPVTPVPSDQADAGVVNETDAATDADASICSNGDAAVPAEIREINFDLRVSDSSALGQRTIRLSGDGVADAQANITIVSSQLWSQSSLQLQGGYPATTAATSAILQPALWQQSPAARGALNFGNPDELVLAPFLGRRDLQPMTTGGGNIFTLMGALSTRFLMNADATAAVRFALTIQPSFMLGGSSHWYLGLPLGTTVDLGYSTDLRRNIPLYWPRLEGSLQAGAALGYINDRNSFTLEGRYVRSAAQYGLESTYNIALHRNDTIFNSNSEAVQVSLRSSLGLGNHSQLSSLVQYIGTNRQRPQYNIRHENYGDVIELTGNSLSYSQNLIRGNVVFSWREKAPWQLNIATGASLAITYGQPDLAEIFANTALQAPYAGIIGLNGRYFSLGSDRMICGGAQAGDFGLNTIPVLRNLYIRGDLCNVNGSLTGGVSGGLIFPAIAFIPAEPLYRPY
jgi:hypothetical protein